MEITVTGYFVCQTAILSICAILNFIRKGYLNKLKALDEFVYEESKGYRNNKNDGYLVGKYIRTMGNYYSFKITQINDYKGEKKHFLTRELINGRCTKENISLLNRLLVDTITKTNYDFDINSEMFYNHFLYENDYVSLLYKNNAKTNFPMAYEIIQGNLYDLKNYYKDNNEAICFSIDILQISSIFLFINFIFNYIRKVKETNIENKQKNQMKELYEKYLNLKGDDKRKFQKNVIEKIYCNKCKLKFKSILILNCGHFNLCKECFELNSNKCYLCDISEFKILNIS